ncbi:MAG TPA: SprT family zinc-dependent metalloprotease [Steroidobacteraceae bacterium]|nr:SprT family zinc-dependent metalloprotease [Steroidobacteraceae bacterium]
MSSSNELRGESGDGTHFQLDLLDAEARSGNGDGPLVRLSRRARRLSIRVYPDARVEVVAPPRARPRDIEQFVAAHRQWIDEKRGQALRNRPAPEAFPPATLTFQLTGEQFRIGLAGGEGKVRLTERAQGLDGELRVSGRPETRALRIALRAWLMRAARERLEPRLAALAAATGVPYSKVAIRRQRSRWGSCSARGTISLNCCLLFQRHAVVDYLIIHELMHVAHMNHSAKFWQAVERHCADWRALDRELVQGWRHVPRWVFSDA